MSADVPALRVRGLVVEFGGVRALNGVDLDVPGDALLGLIGPNGAGKTSLLNVLSGVYRARRGTVELLGESVTDLPSHAFATRGVARTFQNLALFANQTVLDNVLIGAALRADDMPGGVLRRRRERERASRWRAEMVLELLELTHERLVRVADLPYGLAKRVDLARAVAMSPRVLLLDEPVAGMNEEEVEDIARYILDIREEYRPAIVLVEHHLPFVMDLTETISVLDFGAVIFSGPPMEAQRDQRVLEAYIGGAPVGS